MIVTINVDTETSTGLKSKAIMFREDLNMDQLQRLNDLANELAEENQ